MDCTEEIAVEIGKVLKADANNSISDNHIICLAINRIEGWEPILTVRNNVNGQIHEIIVDTSLSNVDSALIPLIR